VDDSDDPGGLHVRPGKNVVMVRDIKHLAIDRRHVGSLHFLLHRQAAGFLYPVQLVAAHLSAFHRVKD
jgi:hypothetical protein